MTATLRKAIEATFASFSEFSEQDIDGFVRYLDFRFGNLELSTGETYEHYFLDVIARLVELNLDKHSIYAGVLWRVFYVMKTPEEEIQSLFGREVFELAERVYRIDSLDFLAKEGDQSEKFSHLIFALARDLRVVFILLADRAHILSAAQKMEPALQRKIALECREIYAPIANRLGIGKLKFELEDLSFKILDPEIFSELNKKIIARTADREKYLKKVESIIAQKLKEEKITAQIKGRSKHFTSIYKKMLVQKIPFDEVYDLVGIRVITETEKECYAVLGIIHSLWKPIPRRFKDYIAMPKQNMYQSIHTSVIGPSAYPLEVQIRTKEMDRVSEIGIAAHWRYKEKGLDERHTKKFIWLRQLLDWQRENKDPIELMELLKVDLFPDEVYVFTPKGDVKSLTKGSTIVDFAFFVHSDIGLRCKGGRINGRLAPIRAELNNGDIVEILTGSRPVAHADWLGFVKTNAARNKIKKYLRDRTREKTIEDGKNLLTKALKKQKIWTKAFLTTDEFTEMLKKLGFQTSDEFCAALGFGEINLQNVINKITIYFSKKSIIDKIAGKPVRQRTPRIKVADSSEIAINFARCCEPLPGEEIVGFVTVGRGVTIHASRCSNVKKYAASRILRAQWETDDRPSYPLRITYIADDKGNISNEITKILINHNVMILSQNSHHIMKNRIKGEFKIEIMGKNQLEAILAEIKLFPNVLKVSRSLARN